MVTPKLAVRNLELPISIEGSSCTPGNGSSARPGGSCSGLAAESKTACNFSEREFGAVVGRSAPPDRVIVDASLAGEFDPDVRAVDPDIIARVAQRRIARIGHFRLFDLRIIELAILGGLEGVAGPGGDRFLDEVL